MFSDEVMIRGNKVERGAVFGDNVKEVITRIRNFYSDELKFIVYLEYIYADNSISKKSFKNFNTLIVS